MKLLSLVPSWAYALAVAVLIGALFYVDSKLQHEIAAHARDNAAADKRQADAVTAELKRGNETADLLRKNHAEALEQREVFRKEADAAIAARDAAHTMARRVRDASATDLLAARAAVESAGATATCGPALDAATVRDELFRRCVDAAQGMGSQLAAMGRYADALKGDDASCRRDYKTVTR